MKKLIKSKRIYTERGCIDGGFIVEDGKFKKIYFEKDLPKDFDGQVIDYDNQRILPGIIEMHIHGYMGWNAMSPDKEEIKKLAKALTTCGVTGFTPSNHYLPHVFENNKAIAQAMEEERVGARIFGIHMEGPFISTEKLGSVELDEVKKPDLELMKKYIETANGHITTVTLAPEIEGNLEIIDYLVEKGINVCIGHTNATYDETMEAIDRGAIITQKTGNCMRGMHHREMGVVGAALLDQRIYNEINSDGAHTSIEFLDLCYRLKGRDKLCIIADSGVMSGMKQGRYHLPDRGPYEVGKDNLLHIEDGTIDGSILHILHGIRVWVEQVGIPMEDAVVMASLNPARVLKIDHEKGSIKECKDADFTIITDDYNVVATYVEGNLEYDARDETPYENVDIYKYLIEAY